jgi:TetR/AcrR family transcriptional regulator
MAETVVRQEPERTARERLMAAAAELFAVRGYDATSVREIVERARVTKPALYYHFGSKEGIYLAMLEAPSARFKKSITDLKRAPVTAPEQLKRLCKVCFGFFLENTDLFRMMHGILYGPPQGAPPFDFEALHHLFFETIEESVREGQRKRELRRGDVRAQTLAIIGALDMAIELNLMHPELAVGERELSRTLDVVFSGVAAPRAPRRTR